MKAFYIATTTFFILLSSCGSSKFVDTSSSWKSVAEMEDNEIFVETTSLKRVGTSVIAREKKVFYTVQQKEAYVAKIRDKYAKLGKPEKVSKWADFSYTIYTSEYDCLNSQFRVLSVEDFDSQGVRIIKTKPNKNSQKWLSVDKETVGDYTFFFVCDYEG